MNTIEFLEARIAEDETAAREVETDFQFDPTSPLYSPLDVYSPGGYDTAPVISIDSTRVLAECAAKRAIIKQHEAWPVLVEGELEMEPATGDLQNLTYRASRQIAWLTEREYIKRFGTEPPTTPMIRALAAVYKDHPDYRPEWSS